MKTIFTINSEESDENLIVLTFMKPIKIPKFVQFIEDMIKVEKIEKKLDSISLEFSDTESGFILLQSILELFFEKHIVKKDVKKSSFLYDEKMNPISRPKRKGKVHKIQKPSV